MLAGEQSLSVAAGQAERFLARLAAADQGPIADVSVAIVVAHPDDETIGIGGQLARVAKSLVVVATDGAPRDGIDARDHGFATWQDYAAARRRELGAALAEAGIAGERIIRLGVPDKEGALHLAALARLLAKIFRRHLPDVVVTH